MADIPKLHGWITPHDAMQMVEEMIVFLQKNGYLTITDYMTDQYEAKIRFYKCPFMITSAQNVTS